MHKDCVASRTEETGLTNPAALDRPCGSGALATITSPTYIHARFRGECAAPTLSSIRLSHLP
jgi:hypothetical protein